ncbi:MAG: hypothetical protein HQK56_05945, partial [Deltaproteobacteria bacterium]|nr:hypothetical protein [Deltaproteobacteria bacterium]
MRLSLRNRIFLNFVLVIALFAIVGAVMGTFFINRTTVEEEQRRVNVDLRSAWSVINGKFNELSILVNVLGTGKRVAGVYQESDSVAYRASLEAARIQFGLDFLGLTDDRGQAILRTRSPYQTGDELANDPFVGAALKGQTTSGFHILSPERLNLEGSELPERAFTVFEPTPKAKDRAKTSEKSGMVM